MWRVAKRAVKGSRTTTATRLPSGDQWGSVRSRVFMACSGVRVDWANAQRAESARGVRRRSIYTVCRSAARVTGRVLLPMPSQTLIKVHQFFLGHTRDAVCHAANPVNAALRGLDVFQA